MLRNGSALLLLAALAGCDLDDFAWGGPRERRCEVAWKQAISSPLLGDDPHPPEVRDVDHPSAGNVTWTAHYGPIAPQLRITDFFFEEQQLHFGSYPWHVSGPCAQKTRPSTLRDEPLSRYTCQLHGRNDRGAAIALELRLEEVEICE